MLDPSNGGVQAFLNPTNYGVDYDGPLPDIQTSNVVEIPQSSITLEEDDENILQMLVNPLTVDGNHGIVLYKQTLSLMHQMLNNPSY